MDPSTPPSQKARDVQGISLCTFWGEYDPSSQGLGWLSKMQLPAYLSEDCCLPYNVCCFFTPLFYPQ